jgi:hypothetical protein
LQFEASTGVVDRGETLAARAYNSLVLADMVVMMMETRMVLMTSTHAIFLLADMVVTMMETRTVMMTSTHARSKSSETAILQPSFKYGTRHGPCSAAAGKNKNENQK